MLIVGCNCDSVRLTGKSLEDGIKVDIGGLGGRSVNAVIGDTLLRRGDGELLTFD